MHLSVGLAVVIAAGIGAQAPDPQAWSVRLELDDSRSDHVHLPGSRDGIRLRADAGVAAAGCRLIARWYGPTGEPIGEPIAVPREGVELTLQLPARTEEGYYGLRVDSDEPRVAFPPFPAGHGSREFGFAVLSAERSASIAEQVQEDSPFGVVHGRIDDPRLRGGVKTLTWNTLSPRWWARAMRERREAGLLELPLVYGADWDSDDTRPIREPELARLAERFRRYLVADPAVGVWELGLEENAGGRYRKEAHYLRNLAAKVRRLRVVADSVRPGVRFVYNFVGFKLDDIGRLAASGALSDFQVLSLHPYRWPDFPPPSQWLMPFVSGVRARLAEHDLAGLPIWFTEFGLPRRGQPDPVAFFGYPATGRQVPGATLDEAARYLVQGHALAFASGVEKLFVYNYQDRGESLDYAEDHFGLRTRPSGSGAVGHPTPAYVAYCLLVDRLEGQRLRRWRRDSATEIYVFEWGDSARSDRALVWREGAAVTAARQVRLAALIPGLAAERLVECADLYGAPVATIDEAIMLAERPLFLRW